MAMPSMSNIRAFDAGQSEIQITDVHKAAIILASLNTETAAMIVQEMNDDELRLFFVAFSELESVSQELLNAIAGDFVDLLKKSEGELFGGADEASRVLKEISDEDRGERIMSALNGKHEEPVWTRLEKLNATTLADYIQQQRPLVAAVILSKINQEKSAEILVNVEEEFSKAVLLELSKQRPASEKVISAIETAIRQELLEKEDPSAASVGAASFVGEIINYLPAAKRDAILQFLTNEDEDIGQQVRKSVLIFEEVYNRLTEAAVPSILRGIPQPDLILALKYGENNAPETTSFILGNITKRMADSFREEMAEIDAPDASNGEAAQRKFIASIRRLADSGEIELKQPIQADVAT